MNNLKALRLIRKMTIPQVAKSAKLSKGLISKLENTERLNPTLKTIMSLSMALKVCPSEMFKVLAKL